jgi:hypothetical protein
MKKIDDLKLQMYVDNELSKEESIEVENYLKIDNEARSLVENYKKINHLISSTYSQIKSDDLPKKTLDLLMDEKPSFLNKLFNYEVKLFPTLGSVAALAIVAVMGINIFKIDNNSINPTNLMSENNKHVVLNELQDILKDSEDNLSGIVSFKNKNIEYKEVKSYLDSRGRPCKDIKFENFSIKDAKINEATFVKLSSGEWKVIKLEFIKDSSLGI